MCVYSRKKKDRKIFPKKSTTDAKKNTFGRENLLLPLVNEKKWEIFGYNK